MRADNILYVFLFVSAAFGLPVAEAEANAIAEANPEAAPEANPEAAPEAIADPEAEAEADPTWGYYNYYNRGTKFNMCGYGRKSYYKKDIYVCRDGRLTYGYRYSGSVKFKGSYYNGCLYGNTVGNAYYGVGCNNRNYFVVGNSYPKLHFNYGWNNYLRSKVVKPNNKCWCDDQGYIVKEKPKQCNACEEIEFEAIE